MRVSTLYNRRYNYKIFFYTEEFYDCVSREEFESLQKELHYWQNTTITILKIYLIDNEGKLIQKIGNILLRLHVEG